MNSAFTSLLLLTFTLAEAAGETTSSLDIGELCENITCTKLRPHCRVVKQAKPQQPIVTRCMKCVPAGTDGYCMRKGYARSVLIKKPNKKSPAEPHYCHLLNVTNKIVCPSGSSCVPYVTHGELGVCCYGNRSKLQKEDTDCGTLSSRLGLCGHSTCNCTAGLDVFGRIVDKCRDDGSRFGTCLESEPDLHSEFSRDSNGSQCNRDDDCAEGYKCCSTSYCGTKYCTLNYNPIVNATI